jgi:uncharacterized membrane protein
MSPSFKVSKFKKVDDFLFWSVIFEACLVLLAMLLAALYEMKVPISDLALAQKMLELTITLDGVLFGFSAVMIGFFFRSGSKMSESKLKLSLWWALVAFWSYISSILLAFIAMSELNQQTRTIPIFTPIQLTIFGSIFTSIYMVLIFIEENFPVENELTKK